jgi:hypothetical protein
MSSSDAFNNIHPSPRAWALRQLGLDEKADHADVRAAALRRLHEEDFVPPWTWQQGFMLLGRPNHESALVHGRLLQDEEERLRGEVSAFAGVLFELDRGERQRRWQALREPCELYPALCAWLQELEKGLSVQSLEIGGTAEYRQLAVFLAELLVLRRTPRATRRRAILADLKSELAKWEGVAFQVQCANQEIAAFDPRLLQQLHTCHEAAKWSLKRYRTEMARRQVNIEEDRARGRVFLVFAVVLFMLFSLIASSLNLPGRTSPAQRTGERGSGTAAAVPTGTHAASPASTPKQTDPDKPSMAP